MSRGLTDAPEPEQNEEGTPTIEQMDGALRELYAFTGSLSGRIEELENIIAKAISFNVPEDKTEEPKRYKGL
jgi:formate hydrogenlyase subunit 6/NADH:ubiquinone oxidoreductase subunit I